MSAHVPAAPFELDPLIAEAKQRARRRRLLAAAALLVVGVATAGMLAYGAGNGSGEVPWLPTTPRLGPVNPPLAPACRASQLRARLGLQGGGFAGVMIGPLTFTNVSSTPCSLVGMPKLSIAGATSSWSLRRGPQHSEYDPLQPAQSSLRALAPGRSAATYLTWSGWCGRGSSRYSGNPGQPPQGMLLSSPGGGRVRVASKLSPDACPPGGGSTLAASRFVPIVPQGPPSSALPLGARIVATETAHRGMWLAYTVVLRNRSAKPFSFGRSCPAYEEGFDLRPQAYVLNCHAVGTIAPHGVARLEMKILVPRHGNLSLLTWTLAPHSWGGGVLATTRP